MPISKAYNKSFRPSAPVVDCMISGLDETQASPRTCQALIDTGADITALPQNIITELKLTKVHRILVAGYNEATATQLKDVYTAKVSIPPMAEKIDRVIVTAGEHALIGRDLINHWTVTLHGKKGIAEIEEG